VIAAFDFFTVPTMKFGVLDCLFVIERERRRILYSLGIGELFEIEHERSQTHFLNRLDLRHGVCARLASRKQILERRRSLVDGFGLPVKDERSGREDDGQHAHRGGNWKRFAECILRGNNNDR
jgi:hypothetical protein